MDRIIKEIKARAYKDATDQDKLATFESFCRKLTSDSSLIESIVSGVSLIENYTSNTFRSSNNKSTRGDILSGDNAMSKFQDNEYVRDLFTEYKKLNSDDTHDETEKENAIRDERLDRIKAKYGEDSPEVRKAIELIGRDKNKAESAPDRRLNEIALTIMDAAYSQLFHHCRKLSVTGSGDGSPELISELVGEYQSLIFGDKFVNNVINNVAKDDQSGKFYAFLTNLLKQNSIDVLADTLANTKNITRTSRSEKINWRPGVPVLNITVDAWRKQGPVKMKQTLPNIVAYRNSTYKLKPEALSAAANTEEPDNSEYWQIHASDEKGISTDTPLGTGDGSKTLGDTLMAPVEIDAAEEAQVNQINEYLDENMHDIDFMKRIRKAGSGHLPKVDNEDLIKYFELFNDDELYNIIAKPVADNRRGNAAVVSVDEATMRGVFGPTYKHNRSYNQRFQNCLRDVVLGDFAKSIANKDPMYAPDNSLDGDDVAI